mmetsp:Transcript_7905/g.19226  ORF Transcript_7905/g.19226 Transcript_7905/m.19226 type:complete len:213 (+) Transcript_7905:46-684(+)
MTDPTWEDAAAALAKAPAPVPALETTEGVPSIMAALVCAECKQSLVLQVHLIDEEVEQGEGDTSAGVKRLGLFEREFPCYQVLGDDVPGGERERIDLVIAVKEDAKLPSKDGWIDNPKALGQGLHLSECTGWPGKEPDLDTAWFRGYTRRAAHCAECKADVAYLFEPDAMYFILYVGTNASGKGNGNAFGMIPFWGLRVAQTRVGEFAQPQI